MADLFQYREDLFGKELVAKFPAQSQRISRESNFAKLEAKVVLRSSKVRASNLERHLLKKDFGSKINRNSGES